MSVADIKPSYASVVAGTHHNNPTIADAPIGNEESTIDVSTDTEW